MRWFRFIVSFSLIGLSAWAEVASPGEIVWLDLPAATRPPVVYFQGNRVRVVKTEEGWQASVGLPLNLKEGTYRLQLDRPEGRDYRESIEVVPKHYPSENINLPVRKGGKPDPKFIERLEREKAHIAEVLSHFREIIPTEDVLTLPVHGRWSTPFGYRRSYNHIPAQPHSGLDIAAPQGTSIRAPADGIVADVGRYMLTGNTVIVDHGMGMMTIYAHLKKTSVRLGQPVRRGTLLGQVGKTGRATGPHLHWGLVLNQARVNPALMLEAKEKAS